MEPPNNNQTYLVAFVESLAVERETDRGERERRERERERERRERERGEREREERKRRQRGEREREEREREKEEKEKTKPADKNPVSMYIFHCICLVSSLILLKQTSKIFKYMYILMHY